MGVTENAVAHGSVSTSGVRCDRFVRIYSPFIVMGLDLFLGTFLVGSEVARPWIQKSWVD